MPFYVHIFTNIREGYGEYFYNDANEIYFGNWHNDVQEGDGKYYYGNGDVYEGKFADGKSHGFGMYVE